MRFAQKKRGPDGPLGDSFVVKSYVLGLTL
jgi:hypothetical protein